MSFTIRDLLHQDLQNSNLCQNASSLMALPSVSITSHSRSSTSSDSLMVLWHCVELVSSGILAMLFGYYHCTLVISRDILFLSKEAKRLKDEVHIAEKPHALASESGELAERRATLSTSGPRSYVSANPRIFHGIWSTLMAGLMGELTLALACAVLLASSLFIRRQLWLKHQALTTTKDEEAQGHLRGATDLLKRPFLGERKQPSACKDAKAQINDGFASARSLGTIF